MPANITLGSGLARPGDTVLLSGFMGDHGVTIMSARAGLSLESSIESDTASLHTLVSALLKKNPEAVRCLRDPTRGGVATVLHEIAEKSHVQIKIDENNLPVRPGVNTACEMLGLDPLYLANEGKCIAIVDPEAAEDLLTVMHNTVVGKDARIIGSVQESKPDHRHGRVILKTVIGGARVVGPLSGEPLPRIC